MSTSEMKECFGQLANMSIRWRDQSKQHYLRVDDEKLRECDQCHLFTKCMFLKHNEMISELLRIINSDGQPTTGRRMG